MKSDTLNHNFLNFIYAIAIAALAVASSLEFAMVLQLKAEIAQNTTLVHDFIQAWAAQAEAFSQLVA